jgi:peroxiredoxin Q/BCP
MGGLGHNIAPADVNAFAGRHMRIAYGGPDPNEKEGQTMLQDGDKAPDFELPTDGGETLVFSRLKGKAAVLYFYPKDDTSGCTAEAKDFTRLASDFRKAGVEVIGVSPDSVDSHAKFRKKYDLAVRLAADADKAVANAYGVWVEKSMYGRKYMGVERSTFLIDGKGRIAKSWRKVKVPGHAEEVLEAARQLKS